MHIFQKLIIFRINEIVVLFIRLAIIINYSTDSILFIVNFVSGHAVESVQNISPDFDSSVGYRWLYFAK